MLKSRFRDKEHSKTLHLTKYKTKYVHISCFKSREMITFLFLNLVSMQAKISFSRQGTFHYFHFAKYKIKQVHKSCFKSRNKFNLLIYQICNYIGKYLIFATKIIPKPFIYRILNQIGTNTMLRFKGHRGTNSTLIFTKLVTIQE